MLATPSTAHPMGILPTSAAHSGGGMVVIREVSRDAENRGETSRRGGSEGLQDYLTFRLKGREGSGPI